MTIPQIKGVADFTKSANLVNSKTKASKSEVTSKKRPAEDSAENISATITKVAKTAIADSTVSQSQTTLITTLINQTNTEAISAKAKVEEEAELTKTLKEVENFYNVNIKPRAPFMILVAAKAKKISALSEFSMAEISKFKEIANKFFSDLKQPNQIPSQLISQLEAKHQEGLQAVIKHVNKK